MSVPSRVEAAAILRRTEPNDSLLRHSIAVAEVAAFICAAMGRRGVAIRADVVEAAALLHDVDKAHADGHLRRTRGHGTGGAEWLAEQGYGELAAAVTHHPVGSLGDAQSYEAWAAATGLEGMVVAYADKRAMQDLVTMDERFERWRRRFPTSEMLVVARERADRLEQEICGQAGLAPGDIGRLPWVADALRQTET